jgi:hypothetical protein
LEVFTEMLLIGGSEGTLGDISEEISSITDF